MDYNKIIVVTTTADDEQPRIKIPRLWLENKDSKGFFEK